MIERFFRDRSFYVSFIPRNKVCLRAEHIFYLSHIVFLDFHGIELNVCYCCAMEFFLKTAYLYSILRCIS